MSNSIILFDGVCNLCNSIVNFIIERDYKNKYKFCTIQSGSGQKILQQISLNTSSESIILIEENKYYRSSTAVLKIARDLKAFWKVSYIFIVIPPFIRNFLYEVVAKNRYKWFGVRDSCRVPTNELKAKFIE